MTNEEFLSTLKEGDFITAQHNQDKAKLIACFDKRYKSYTSYHCVCTKFFIGYVSGIIRVGLPFVCGDEVTTLRKATMDEIFTLIDALRKKGYRYNRKKKIVINKETYESN